MKKLILLILPCFMLAYAEPFYVKPITPNIYEIDGAASQGSLTTVQTNLQAQIDDMVAAYGSVYIHDGTNTVALTTTNYTLVSMWSTDNPQSKAAPTNCVALTNGVRVLMAGVYDVSYSLSMIGENNSTLEAGIFVDGVHQDIGEFNRKISTGADVGSAGAVGQLVLASNQLVNVGRISDVAGIYTIKQGSLRLTRISPVSTVDGFNYALKDGSNITEPAAFSSAIGLVTPKNIVCFGDSNTGGSSNTNHVPSVKYPTTLAGWFKSSTVVNAGVSGYTINGVITNSVAYTNYVSSNTLDVATLMIGVNNFSAGNTVADAVTGFKSLIDTLQTQGYDYVVVIGYYAWNEYALPLREYNKQCRDYCIKKGAGWIDLDAGTVASTNGLVSPAYYFADGDQHLNQSGHDMVASLLRSKLLSLEKATASDTAYPFIPNLPTVSTFDAVVAADFEQTKTNLVTEYTAPSTVTGSVSTVTFYDSVRGGRFNPKTNDMPITWSKSAKTNVTVILSFSATNSGASFERIHKFSGGSQALNVTAEPSINVVRFYLSGAATGSALISSIYMFDGGWHFVAGVRSGTNINFFIDGVKSYSTFTNTTDFSAITKSYIGTETNGTTPLSGSIDDVYIFPRALSEDEILSIYTKVKGGEKVFRSK